MIDFRFGAHPCNEEQGDTSACKQEITTSGGHKSVYPEGKLAAQILGFVNGESKGQYWVEEGMNDQLSGKDGQLKAVTDVNGIPLSIGQDNVQTPAVDGTDVVLSIDRNIQSYAEAAPDCPD